MKYLVTGHTGFKGSWLSLWLAHLGHEVHGVALPPPPGGLFEAADVASVLASDNRCDIREPEALNDLMTVVAPDVVIHLAAQPLVRESYRDPRTTFTTNVSGTMNVLEAAGQLAGTISAMLIITTDKVYRNVNQTKGYREDDPLGGEDPYSASKAMADLLTQSWVKSFPGVPTAIARAGNVIGAGDVSPDRLLPDLINSYTRGAQPTLRYPHAVRPWQHVLDCLNGYMMVVDALLDGRGTGAWNFGPDDSCRVTVAEVCDEVADLLEQPRGYQLSGGQPSEAGLLTLDCSKAREELGWRNQLGLRDALSATLQPATSAEAQIAQFRATVSDRAVCLADAGEPALAQVMAAGTGSQAVR